MLKKLFIGAKENIKKTALKVAGTTAALGALIFAKANSSFAADADLTQATTMLTDGAGELKTNSMTIIGVCIGIVILVFGILWLTGVFKRGVNKA